VNRVFKINFSAADMIGHHDFYDTKFINITEGALAYFYDPPQKWAIIKDCGEFTCTGPKNLVYDFARNTFEGVKPRDSLPNFVLIANNTETSPYIKGCKPQIIQNTYICENEYISQLIFESNDDDKVDRSLQPIYLA
jgi:hypothetical protein